MEDFKNGNVVKIIERITRVEECIGNLRDEVGQIKNNHLHDLGERLDRIEQSVVDLRIYVAKWGGGLAVAVVVLQFVIKFIK